MEKIELTDGEFKIIITISDDFEVSYDYDGTVDGIGSEREQSIKQLEQASHGIMLWEKFQGEHLTHLVVLNRDIFRYEEQAGIDRSKKWVSENATDWWVYGFNYPSTGKEFIYGFKSSDDAMLFKMKWG